MSRARVCLAGVAAALTLAGVTAGPAVAATASQADAWADFQKPDQWLPQADSLHWYVQSPVVTNEMVGSPIHFVVTSPAAIDCNNFGGGFSDGTTWTNVDFAVRSCEATELDLTATPTTAMVGQRVSLVGWTATTARTATVTADVTVLGSTSHTRTPASRTDVAVPVGPLQQLGTTGGHTVSLASDAKVNEVWVDSTRVAAPSGTVLTSRLDVSVVHLVVQVDPTNLAVWSHDVATGATTEKLVPIDYSKSVSVFQANAHGFIVDTLAPDVRRVYNWDGADRGYIWSRTYRILGLSGDYVGSYGQGMTPTFVTLTRLSDGTEINGSNKGMVEQVTLDPTTPRISYVSTSMTSPVAVSDCVLTPAGNTCTNR